MKFKLFAMALISAVALTFAAAYAGQDSSMKNDSGMHSSKDDYSMREGAATGGQEMSSDTIEQAQQALNQQGYDIGSESGQVGSKTSDAIKKFQKDKGIEASGKLDSETLAALGVSPGGAAAGGGSEGAAGKSDSMNSGSMQNSGTTK